jgi:hypothetical protein
LFVAIDDEIGLQRRWLRGDGENCYEEVSWVRSDSEIVYEEVVWVIR